jgi:hypothetical protein
VRDSPTTRPLFPLLAALVLLLCAAIPAVAPEVELSQLLAAVFVPLLFLSACFDRPILSLYCLLSLGFSAAYGSIMFWGNFRPLPAGYSHMWGDSIEAAVFKCCLGSIVGFAYGLFIAAALHGTLFVTCVVARQVGAIFKIRRRDG